VVADRGPVVAAVLRPAVNVFLRDRSLLGRYAMSSPQFKAKQVP